MSTRPLPPDFSPGASECPPTPAELPLAVQQAITSDSALRIAERQWELSNRWSTDYQRMVRDYEGRLARALTDRAALRQEMLAFGAYLRDANVPAEHVYACVRDVVDEVHAAQSAALEHGLRHEIAAWALEGYHTPK